MASIFSKIIQGEIPCYKIAENQDFIAFLDIQPLTLGHTLVVPKQEIDYIFDLNDNVLKELMVFSKHIAQAMDKVIDCNRIGVSVIGLEVPHTHVHLIPISSLADMDFTKTRPTYTAEQMQEICNKIGNEYNQPTWSYSDFLALLLIYSANVSEGISEEEQEFIQHSVDSSNYTFAKSFFDKHSEVEVIEQIDELANTFSPNQRSQIQKDVLALINVDSRGDKFQAHIARMLQRIL